MTCESSNHITDKNLKEQIIKEKRRDHKGTLVPLIVIGAGVSGLTVAASLECDFLVLEARDRIGGRVWSRECSHGSCTLDMGAAWIHGTTNNPLNHYLKCNEMIPVSESNPWIHTGNARIMYQGVSNETRQQMIISWNRTAKEIAEMDCETIAEAIKHVKDSSTSNIQTFLYLLEVWCGTSVSSMPPSFLRNIECDDSLFGDYAGSHCLFKKGTKSLITSIVEGSKQDLDDRILFEQVVTDILYDRDDGCIEIKTRDPNVSYLCEKLVITTPPGPLKDINFVPPLSASRKCALSKVKMGSYKKVQVEFDHVFWDTDAAMILTNKNMDVCKNGDSESKNDGCKNDVFGCKTSSFIPHILWNNYACLKGAPILEAVCPANIGWQLTGKSDEEIADAVLEHLRGMYPWMPDPIS